MPKFLFTGRGLSGGSTMHWETVVTLRVGPPSLTDLEVVGSVLRNRGLSNVSIFGFFELRDDQTDESKGDEPACPPEPSTSTAQRCLYCAASAESAPSGFVLAGADYVCEGCYRECIASGYVGEAEEPCEKQGES